MVGIPSIKTVFSIRTCQISVCNVFKQCFRNVVRKWQKKSFFLPYVQISQVFGKELVICYLTGKHI